MIRIATWNVNSLRVRLPHVQEWVRKTQPDLLALQETKLQDKDFPTAEIEGAGYHILYAGQKTYNGVALLSRQPLREVITTLPGMDDGQCRLLGATCGAIRVLNVYVPNGERVESEKYRYKMAWLASLTAYLDEQLAIYPRLVVLGDFNIAPEARDVHDPALWEGRVLFSEPERVAFARLLEGGVRDTFRLFEQEERQYSWWDYRMAGFRRNLGLRIDHILASTALAAECATCHIDKAPRGWERPSDHAPVVAEFEVEKER